MSGWGYSDRSRWDPPATSGSCLALLLIAAVLSAVGITAYRYAALWTPLQRRYLPSYLRSAVALTTSGSYELLQVVGRTGTRLALDTELVTVTSATGDASFALSDAARQAGATRLVWQRQPYYHAALHTFLARWIYHDQTLINLAQPALWGALALLLGGILGAQTHAVQARAWRARHAPHEAQWTPASPVIDCVERTPSARDPARATADQRADHGRLSIPARLPARSTGALAAGDVSRGPGSLQAQPGSWPNPLFK